MPDPLRTPPFWSEPSWIEDTPSWVESDTQALFLPPVFAPKSWEIDSSLELIADHWSAQMAESAYFRFADPNDRVTLQAGLLDVNNNAVMITALTNAVIDEREIVIGPRDVIVTLRGRDASAAILDSYFTKLYARTEAAKASALQAFAEIEAGQAAFVDAPPAQVGNFKASQVARDAVESVGMSLSWEVRHYEIQTPLYNASGRVVDILRKLISPWMLCDPFKVDIVIVDKTIRVKHRGLPTQTPPPQYIMSAQAAKRSRVTIRRRVMRKIGTVTLRGRRIPPGLSRASKDQIRAGSGVYVADTQTVRQSDTAFDSAGNMLSKTETISRYRQPDGILLSSFKSVSTLRGADPAALGSVQGSPGAQLQLVTRENVEHVWESSVYEGSAAVNAPKQLSTFVAVSGIDFDNDPQKLFRTLSEATTAYSYDSLGFRTGETTTKAKFSFDDNKMVPTERIVKTLRDIGPLLVEEIVDIFKWDSDKKFWIIKERLTSQSGGHRPGGPGRGFSRSVGVDQMSHYTLTKTFSEDADAQAVEYSNDDLSLEDLNFIMAQFEAMANLVEYEFQFSGVSMPWLRRGVTIQFTDLPLGDGSTLTPVVATITEIKTAYIEGGRNSMYTISCRAFGWGAA
jgi:YD repeat-containing protein